MSAFRHKAYGTITVVLINNGSTATADIALPTFTMDITSYDVFTSTSEASWRQISVSPVDGGISVTIPENGIVTVYGQGNAPVRRNRLLPAVLQTNKTATGIAAFLFPSRSSGSAISENTRFYSLRGEYLGTLRDMHSGDHRSLPQGMYILRHPTDIIE